MELATVSDDNPCLVRATIQEVTKASTKEIAKSTVTLDTEGRVSHVEASLKSLVDGSITTCTVNLTTPTTCDISYSPQVRGRHQLSVSLDNCEVATADIFVHHPPTQLGVPVRVIQVDTSPIRGICIDSEETLYVAAIDSSVSKLDKNGQLLQTFGDYENEPFDNYSLYGVAVGEDGSIYVTAEFRLFKLNKHGELIKTVCDTIETFYCARLMRFHNNQLYLCDRSQHRVQIFDADLNIVASFGVDKLSYPTGIDFDSNGNAYVADYGSRKIVVFDNYDFVREFGWSFGEDEEDVIQPWGISVFGDHVYVTDSNRDCMSVFNLAGQYVCSFGEFMDSCGIAVDRDGFCYVCSDNGIVVF